MAAALLLCAWSVPSTVAWAQTTPEDFAHSYRLEAEFHPDTHEVIGSGRIRWRNDAEKPASELWFHLYLNAFASETSVFMKEGGGSLRGVRAEGSGDIEILELRIHNGPDLLATADDEVIEGDHTQLRVPLPSPLAGGQSVELEVRFRSRLPPVFARSGYWEAFHMVAQWFPKLAVRERDGTWASFPYHARGEFYADFAHYDLSVITPADYTVGATGQLLSEVREGGFVRRRFVANRVHDVAFCAWNHFREREFLMGAVNVRFLYPPGYEGVVEGHARVVRTGLRHFGQLFGAYPYPNLTVIIPPRGAQGAAGMEYPTLFLTAGPWFWLEGLRVGVQEDVTAHELAHQWFQGLVATNEVRWPMLDEGIAQWATGELMREIYGRDRSSLDILGQSLDYFEGMRLMALPRGETDPPPGSPAHAFSEGEYGRSVYARTALVLETVGRTWGRSRLTEALGRYARTQRNRHPTPEHLFDAFDQSYWPGFSMQVLRPALMQGEVARTQVVSLCTSRECGSDNHVVAERLGAVPLPTTLAVRQMDGATQRLHWPASLPRMRESIRDHTVSVEIDPDHHNLLDESYLDNRSGEPKEVTWFARILFLVQQLMQAVGP